MRCMVHTCIYICACTRLHGASAHTHTQTRAFIPTIPTNPNYRPFHRTRIDTHLSQPINPGGKLQAQSRAHLALPPILHAPFARIHDICNGPRTRRQRPSPPLPGTFAIGPDLSCSPHPWRLHRLLPCPSHMSAALNLETTRADEPLCFTSPFSITPLHITG